MKAPDYPCNNTQAEVRDTTVHQLFEETVEKHPDIIAVECNGQTITYAELNRKANKVAHYLLKQSLALETPVGLYTTRSITFVIGMMGIVKAGCCYVALDPTYPPKRLRMIVKESGLGFILDTVGGADKLMKKGRYPKLDAILADETLSEDNPNYAVSTNSLVYLIYTSGSTGVPKGVAIEHCNLVNLIAWTSSRWNLIPGRHVSQSAKLSFDASQWEYWGNLTTAGTLFITPDACLIDMEALNDFFAKHQIVFGFLPTPVAELFLDSNWRKNPQLEFICSGGDRLVKRPHPDFPATLCNVYGPSEATIIVTEKVVELENKAHGMPSIGKPVTNTQVLILNENLEPVRQGESGEIYLAGKLVGRGYFGNPEKTAEAFIKNPFENILGDRLYKTGDLGRFFPDGEIEFLGRLDFQVKIRGYRIELGEIQSILSTHPDILQNYMMDVRRPDGDKVLVAYIELKNKKKKKLEGLEEWLAETLPDYMIPSVFIFMKDMPLTDNGKIDREKLPEPDWIEHLEEFVPPETPKEEALARVWSNILDIKKIGRNDDFFRLGGHSLKAARAVARLSEDEGYKLTILDLFEQSVLKDVATKLVKLKKAVVKEKIKTAEFPNGVPLSPSQHGPYFFWTLDKTRTDYNIPLRFDIHGEIQIDKFKMAITELVQRHSALRTRFARHDNVPVFFLDPPFTPDIPYIDISNDDDQSGEVERIRDSYGETLFNLEEGKLFRSILIRTAKKRYI
ncbi:MAG: amino acid adenylation domain-containing protein [Candidatus Cloacimonetes bacterium]|nr:amino acid adenylation domain-containing protein [Candidatus Cloacimonadota bacterium]